MRGISLLAVFALPAVRAYSNTFPTIAWSSHTTSALSTEDRHADFTSLLDTLLLNDDLCDNDAVIVVDLPGLRASDLRTLPPSSHLLKAVASAPSALQIPYLRRSKADTPQELATAIARRCGSQVINHSIGSSELASPNTSKKHVVSVGMPPLTGAATHRKANLANHESIFFSDLEKFASAFPKHLIFFSGSHTPQQRRQFANDETHAFQSAPSPDAGILHRYQLLTPGLIVSLLLVFFVLIPAILMGVSALANIQSPLRLEADKKFIQTEKKNQ